MMMENVFKYAAAALFGLLAALEPAVRYAVVLMAAVLLDCWSAYDLSRRLKNVHPRRVAGKFQSRYALRMLRTFLQAYSVVLLLHLVDVVVLCNFGYLNLSNIGAAMFCSIQVWSILENLSSANGARWAKVLQRFMVDKAKRHLNIDLDDDAVG